MKLSAHFTTKSRIAQVSEGYFALENHI